MNDTTGGLAPQQGALPQQGAAVSLADGCYLINLTPAKSSSYAYAGTLRVESTSGRTLASGDFYRRFFATEALTPLPDPKGGIPTFPVADYRYYLNITAIDPAA